MKRGITRRKQVCHARMVPHNERWGDFFFLKPLSWRFLTIFHWVIGSNTLATLQSHSEVAVKSSKCLLYRIFGAFSLGFWTQKYKNVFPLSGNLIYELSNCLWNELLKKKLNLVFCKLLMLSSLSILCHKVQIVLGSQMILEIHPLDTLVRTGLYYCQNIRKTVWDKCVLFVETQTHFTATWMCSINYKNTYKKTWLLKKGTQHFLFVFRQVLEKSTWLQISCWPVVLVRHFTRWPPIPTQCKKFKWT